jgi:DNA-binding NtrC family response regulator
MTEERILVILNDRNLRQKVGKILRIEGHQVKDIESAEDILAVIGQDYFDVVISDWLVGEVPGVEIFKRIQESIPGIRGVFVTEDGGREVVTEAMAAGAAGVLIRPFTPQALLATIRQALRRERERILVVDDDPSVLKVFVDALKQDGYEAVGVKSGVVAIQKVQERPFDLALIDWSMPVLDGIETFRALRDIQHGLKAIMITGHGTPRVLSQVLREGMEGFLIKPFTLQALSTTVQKVLRQCDDEHGCRPSAASFN